MKAILLFLAALALLPGCSHLPEPSTVLRDVDSVGRGVAHVLGWCESAGGDATRIAAAAEAARHGDYPTALEQAKAVVSELRAGGTVVPDETATLLELAEQVLAARAVEQGMRAVSTSKAGAS